MTSVSSVVFLSVVLLLVDNGRTITVNSDKKATSVDRDTQSLKFSSNGEDQLILRDSAFPAVQSGSHANPLRRVGGSSDEFFESGWRPLYSFNSEEQHQDRVSDQLPQESSATVHQLNVVAEPPSNRTTKFIRFSESDIMQHHVGTEVSANRVANAIKFTDSASEEDSYEELAQYKRNFDGETLNITDIQPRMLKFEESDIMQLSGNQSKKFKFEEPVLNNQPSSTDDSVHPANYEVFVIGNLLMNMTSPARYTRNNTIEDTQPRVVQNVEIPAATTNNDQRNSSRYFKFEDSIRYADRTRFEKSSTSSFNFFEKAREEFKFPRTDGIVKPSETSYTSGGSFKFSEVDSRPLGSSLSQTHSEEDNSKPFKFTNTAAVSTRPQSSDDQFYTVKATIQIDGWNNPIITPPSNLVPVTTRRPKKKKGKIYNQHGIDIRKQDGFNYQQPAQYDNYIQKQPTQYDNYAQQQQISPEQYQSSLQIPPTPQNIPLDPYYQTPTNPATQPFDPSTFYIQNYLANYPYQQPIQNYQAQPPAEGSSLYPSVYSQQHPQQQSNVPTNLIPGADQTDSSLSAQSIYGYLQSIFNFAPGTLGSYQTSPAGPTKFNDPSQAAAPTGAAGGSPIMAVSFQLRKALDKIADNDELQCVPKLICMMSRRSTGQGFSTYVNRGLLSTVLSAVPDSSPWLKFSRAALLGYGIGANSCDIYYPKCPKDESEIIFYLNNHRGGFFRFFNDKDVNRG